jgi:hypothetical protein
MCLLVRATMYLGEPWWKSMEPEKFLTNVDNLRIFSWIALEYSGYINTRTIFKIVLFFGINI